MDIPSSSTEPVRHPDGAAADVSILVWDAPVRVFHWLMAFSFAGAYLSAESERWHPVHVVLGYTMAGLVAFRLIWGLVGTRYARFSSFVRGPASVLRYLGALLRGRPEHHVGHNPAGALAILALLLLAVLSAASGWAAERGAGGETMEELHEAAANLMLAVVILHIAGVLLSSWLHRDKLVRSMISGRKQGKPQDGIARAWRGLAAVLLLAVLGFWWFAWQDMPAAAGAGPPAAARPREGEDD